MVTEFIRYIRFFGKAEPEFKSKMCKRKNLAESGLFL